jgi:hypothetical protein
MYLSDLVFTEEGNPKRVGPHKLINYAKCRHVSAIIKKIQQYQQKGYAFEEIKIMQVSLYSLFPSFMNSWRHLLDVPPVS